MSSLPLSVAQPTYRPELDLSAIPARVRALPIHRGYPVPWFVAWVDGVPEFRAMDAGKWVDAYQSKLCWVCGQRLGRFMTFTSGPMCGLNRVSSEPPSHLVCAEWSARNCPFLTRPTMVRREGDELAERIQANVAGIMVRRNPGVTMLWTTTGYSIFDDGKGMYLCDIGTPVSVSWIRERRAATRAEVVESVRTGLPELMETMEDTAQSRAWLAENLARLEALYPAG
jgi:hypothetical protein